MSVDIVMIRNASATDFGGGERVPVFISKELSSSTELTSVILSRSEKLLSFASQQSVRGIRSWWWSVQNWSGPRALLFPAYITWQLLLFAYYLCIFSALRPRIVHPQSKDDFIAATLAARVLRIRVIWSDYADLKHIFLNHRTWYKNPVGKLVYLAAKLAESIIVVSREDRRLILSSIPEGSVSRKLKVIYNGAFDAYSNLKKRESFTFVSSSRLVTDKGIGELITAFKLLVADYPAAELIILGDGPEAEKFKVYAEGTPGISFLGHIENPLRTVESCHVFVLPTYHEGFSVALVEACMLGLPIIATNVGGNPEIITNNETGILVQSKDAHSLYLAMKQLRDNEEFRKQLGLSARMKYVDEFNFKTIITAQFAPIYRGEG